MANFNDIKHEIDQNVNTNGVQAITGAILNETLKDMIDEVDEKKQDTLVAGQNITIQGNVISATGGGGGQEYYEGTAIDIDASNRINVVPSVLPFYLAGGGLNASSSGTLVVDYDSIPSEIAGKGLQNDGYGRLEVKPSDLAGDGLDVDPNGKLAVDTTNLQEKLIAGDGLEIDQNNEISVKAGTGLGFDANGYLINTGGGGGGTTYSAGDGIEIDSNDAINAKLGNGLQLDQNNSIEIDPSVVATQSDIPSPGPGLQVSASNEFYVDTSAIQEKLTAGANITINGNTISATDTNTTYSAGSGLNLNGTTFSVDTSAIQEKLTAGSNITITNNVISSTGGSGATYTAGSGINIDQNNEISVDASDLAGNGLMVDQNGALAVIGGGGSGLWTSGTGTNSLMAPESVSSGATASGTGALNAGYYDSHHPGSISSASGDYSAAFGTGTWAQGDNSFVSGEANTAQGQRAFIGGGINNVASGRNSAVLGGDGGHAVGENTVSISGGYAGPGASAVAIHGTASAIGSVSINGTSEANTSTAIQGGHTYSGASGSVAIIGETDGQYSVAIGKSTHAWNENEVATGSYNKSYQSQTASIATSFTVGNGASGAPSNALEFKKNGDAYLVGVGGFDGTNAGQSGVITLQDAINNGGGSGTSFTPGDALELDQNDNLNVLYGSGLTLNGNNELEVDPNSISGFLPLQGGTLQEDAAGVDRTQLILLSPGNGDVSIAAVISQDEANTQISLDNNSVYETEPGQGESITDITVNNNGETGFALGIASNFVDDNGDWVRDGFESGEFFYSPAGQATPAEIHLDTASSNLSDPGNETSEARITISDDRGYVEFRPNGFYNGSYTLYYPSLSQDETIATLSDIPGSGGSYTAGSGIDITNDVISVDTTTIQGKLTAGSNIQINGNTISATDTNTTYSAGSGLNLNGTTFSADTTVLQEKLVSGTNIKTVNGNSLLGSGDIVISGGQSYSAGQGIDITGGTISADVDGTYVVFNPNGKIDLDFSGIAPELAGTGLSVDSSGAALEVDTAAIASDLSGYFLPLEGGTLQNSSSEPDTRLELTSPGNGDCNIVAYVNEVDSETGLSLNSSSISEREPGLFASNSNLIVNSGGATGFDLSVGASYVEDNGTFTLDEFGSSAIVAGPDGAAEIILETYSSNLSDPGNETNEAKLVISDDRGSIELNPTGFSDGTYTLSFPSLSQDETIATLSDIQGGGSYLPLTGGTLQEDPNDSTSTELLIQSPETYATADLTTVDLDPGNTPESLAKLTLSDYDSSSNPHTAIYGTDGISNGTYKISFPTLTQDDTFALLSDVQGGGGATYTAGTGISISAQNVISNSAPSLWLSGNGSHSVKLNSTLTTANGAYACSIGRYNHADGPDSLAAGEWANATGQSSMALGDNSVSTGTYSAALGYFAQASNEGATAVGAQSYAKNQYEVGIGRYNNSISSGTTAEKTQFTVGCGTSSNSTANLIEAKQNKDIYIYGVGGFDGTNAANASTLQTVLSGKQDTLTAGSGISIVNNVISATGGGGGTSYSAGSGLNLNGTTFSVDTTTIQEKLTAGSGITISGNTISATGGGGGGSCLWSSGTGSDSLVAPGTVSSSLSQDPASGDGAISCGYDTNADGDYAFACGGASSATGDYSFAANNGNAIGDYSAAFSGSGAYGMNSFAAGGGSIAQADYSVALAGGNVVKDEADPNNIIDAQYGVAIGDGSVVEGEYGVAIAGGVASGLGSVSIGSNSTAEGEYDIALPGSNTRGNYSFAASTGQTDSQGHYASALSGGYASGEGSLASGQGSHSWGYSSVALGLGVMTYDQVDGSSNTDSNAGEVALGRYNYTESDIIFSIGCGYYDTEGDQEVHENAVAIDSSGNIFIKGLGGYTGTSTSGCTDLASFLNNL